MVTSNKVPEKKVVKMSDPNGAVVPQRTLLGEVNEHITCPLCRGYYIDATTIVECLHSFCRSCIIKHLKAKSYCPVCEMMINSAKPNIKLDKALQDIVYKLVPGLFQKEMERRQNFYATRPGPAATATPEQRGEDTERIIFSPEDVISFSLEYADATDSDSISSKSSDSNETPTPATTRRYLQCPAVVNISHLKKFLCMKFDIDSSQFAIDIQYKRVPLPDYYTLMDIAYIYNWKRNEPMRFIYQIIDYVAIRNRIFDINRKDSHFHDNKSSPAPTEDTTIDSPVPHVDQGSEASSGTDSPMPEENNAKQVTDVRKHEKEDTNKEHSEDLNSDKSNNSSKKAEDEVEKSQFLNSFELAPKSNSLAKTSPVKPSTADEPVLSTESLSKQQINLPQVEEKQMTDTIKRKHQMPVNTPESNKVEEKQTVDTIKKKHQMPLNTPESNKVEEKQTTDAIKRKHQMPVNTPELKKLKIELEKTKITSYLASTASGSSSSSSNSTTSKESPLKPKESEIKTKTLQGPVSSNVNVPSKLFAPKDTRQQQVPTAQQQNTESSGIKRSVPQHVATSKRKPDMQPTLNQQPVPQKTISPLKIQVPKVEIPRFSDPQKPPVKKIPDLKPSTPSTQSKGAPVNKVRMDLLANNSDPTIDRSKILSQVKSSLSSPNATTPSGDPLKSLFDSCKINIPSSLSITLTDQKQDSRNPNESVAADTKKSVVNKNLSSASSSVAHKVPSPPVHNYIEILKLPDNDSNKSNKTELGNDAKSNQQNKMEPAAAQNKPTTKSSESSGKGPIPNLKPIADTKLAKQSANYAGPITFQQTFEQQIQTLQGDKKQTKGLKNKAQVPKLVPVPSTPKAFSAANKPSTSTTKPTTPIETKPSTALDLSSPHNVQSPSGPPQNLEKAFETMQSIANLAKKQILSNKVMPTSVSQNPSFSSMSNRPIATGSNPIRIPSTSNMNQTKLDKNSSGGLLNISRQESLKHNSMKPVVNSSLTTTTPHYQLASHTSPTATQPSPRQIRSPSSSPKLVIAEDKHSSNSPLDQSTINQSNQITSTQFSNTSVSKSEPPTTVAGPSKLNLKSIKPMTTASKRQPITPNMKPNPANMTPTDYLQPQLMHNALIRHQLEMNGLAWMKQRQQYNFDFFKSMSNLAHQSQNDFNKDKQ